MYLDDIFEMAQTREGLKEHLSRMASVLQSLGFTLNQEKCVWEPIHRVEFLGFIVDSETQMISPLGDKLSKIWKRVQEHERQGQSNMSPTGTDNRLAIISDTSNSTSTPVLSSPSETEIPGSTTVSRRLRVHYPFQHRSTERFALVEQLS